MTVIIIDYASIGLGIIRHYEHNFHLLSEIDEMDDIEIDDITKLSFFDHTTIFSGRDQCYRQI